MRVAEALRGGRPHAPPKPWRSDISASSTPIAAKWGRGSPNSVTSPSRKKSSTSTRASACCASWLSLEMMQRVLACTTLTYDTVPNRSATCRGGDADSFLGPVTEREKSSTSTPMALVARRLASSPVHARRRARSLAARAGGGWHAAIRATAGSCRLQTSARGAETAAYRTGGPGAVATSSRGRRSACQPGAVCFVCRKKRAARDALTPN